MKKCVQCNTEFEDLRHSCPKCGSTAFQMDMDNASDIFDKQTKAAELVTQGDQLMQAGNFKEAEKVLSRAIEINPYNETAHGNMGGVFYFQGRYAEAIPWLEKALEINPNIEGVPEALREARAKAGANPKTTQKSGCFIATACYGSPDRQEVETLRAFRDRRLLCSRLGRRFMDTYYRLSPPVAQLVQSIPLLRLLVNTVVVNPVVAIVRYIDGKTTNVRE